AWSELPSCSSAWASLADISSRKPCPGAKGGEGLREMLPVLDLAAAPAKPPAGALPPGRKPHGSQGVLEALAGALRRRESGRLAGPRSEQRPESSQAPEQAVDSAVRPSGDPALAAGGSQGPAGMSPGATAGGREGGAL